MDATFCTFGGAAAELRWCATKAQLIARHAGVEVRPQGKSLVDHP
jgi:hypothetical protein